MKSTVALAIVLLGIPTAASAAARVSSDSSCPSSDAISVRLLGLLAEGGPVTASARVHIDGPSMRIDLSTPGEANQQRLIPLSGDCDERAEVAALSIASWLDAMPVGAVKAPGIPPRERPPVAVASSRGNDPDDPNWEPTRTSGRTLIGAGGFALVDKQGGTGGIVARAGLPQMIEDIGLQLDASLAYRREVTVGGGTAVYWRPTFALQATAEVYHRRWVARAGVGPALAVLRVDGSGYQTNNWGDTTVMWGADFGLTLARAWQRNELWFSVSGMTWQDRHILSLPETTGSSVAMPAWEGRLAAGISWEVAELWR
jgi:hypothetical protein